MHPSQSSGRRIVVVGGSFAGLGAAYTLRRRLGASDRVTLISTSGQFVFAPSLIWTVLNRKHTHHTFALEPALSARGVEFVRARVREVRVDDRALLTDGDETIQY